MYKEKFKYYSQLIKYRFKGLRSELKFLLAVSLLSIFTSEFILNKINSLNEFQYDAGIVYIKLCYSYLSAFIFYYLVVFAPKERKRVKAFRLINNKIHQLNDLINSILITIMRETDPAINTVGDLSYDEVKEYCTKINADKKVEYYTTGIPMHDSYYDFIQFKASKIKSSVDQLILLNDLIDDNLFLNFSNINDIISNQLTFDYVLFKNQTLAFASHALVDLQFERKEMLDNFQSNYRKRYDFQYHHFERKRNAKKR